jgi:hypothetical protein
MSWPAQSPDLNVIENIQNADIFVSIYIPFHLGKCSYAIVADASPHHDTEFAPVLRARSTKEHVARTLLKNMSWPAQSPDLNVIENIWLYIKRKLEIRIHKINSNSDLLIMIR